MNPASGSFQTRADVCTLLLNLHVLSANDLTNYLQAYLVESLPDVPFDVGELYSGLIPINYTNTSNALFFIFQPTIGPPCDEVTIYLNGGPGWSSFESFFQEVRLMSTTFYETFPYILMSAF
jgi:hypothetical protein